MSDDLSLFEQLIQEIGIEAAWELQQKIAIKFSVAITEEVGVVFEPEECAFLKLWIDFMVDQGLRLMEQELAAEELDKDPFQIGRPGGI